MASLESGVTAVAFASGSAAASAVFHALKPGDHVLCAEDAYFGVLDILREIMLPWQLKVSFVNTTDLDATRAAMTRETRLIWTETPSNPLLGISDLTAIAEMAHRAGAMAVCDNTFATPILQNPLTLGMDLVVHSATKYIGGHSDVMGGIVIARESSELVERIRASQIKCGATPSPFDCWLLRRGVATLHLRVQAQCANAQGIAQHLHAHPAIEKVFYPGLDSHPGHVLAARQMRKFGGIVSFSVRAGEAAAIRAAARVRLLTRATSLGGVESLIEHRASFEGPGTRVPRNLLRISAGVEHLSDLIADLDQALA